MPGRPIAFDLTRMITRMRHASPTGIDRVDLAYARHVLNGDGPRFGLVSTPFGPRVLDRETALAIAESVVSGWVEEASAEDDPVYAALAAALGTGTPPRRAADEARVRHRCGQVRRLRLRVETTLRTLPAWGIERLPRGTIYLHTSHLRLDRPRRFDWLYRRPDIQPVFFVHDLIPISHPEYGRPGEAERHATRMSTIGRHAAGVVVNSEAVRSRFEDHLADTGLKPRTVTVAQLGVEPAFSLREGDAPRFAHPVFLVCGTIESRKNHLLLLNLWRCLVERHGREAPRLVIVGRRGWEAESVFDMLDRCARLRETVIEVAGLGTPALARLMRGANALLMPSFIEGYGLPVVEAAASGLPVVASDIPVHRETANGFAHLLDPLDGPGWRAAIEALAEPNSLLRADLAGRLTGYRPPTWAAHFARVDASLADLVAA